jgi:hypothetical protein
LWDTKSANVIDMFQTDTDGLAMVRRLLSAGWDAEHLSLGLDFDEGGEGDDESLPPVIYGADLAERALAAVSEPSGGAPQSSALP